MTSQAVRDPKKDHLLTPQNSAFVIIDYQPIQVSSIRSMDPEELVFNIVHTAKAVVNYNLPVVHSTVNVATGKGKPPVQPLMDVLRDYPTYDRTTINSWEDIEFKKSRRGNWPQKACHDRPLDGGMSCLSSAGRPEGRL